ncbi:MAG: EamA family transporter [Amphritea sp.]
MEHRSFFSGPGLILLAAICFGFNPLFAQLLFAEGLGAEMVSLYRFILPALLLSFCLRAPQSEWPEVLRMLAIGIANGAAIFCYFYALDTIPAATAILIYYTYPFFSVIVGWLVFKRRPTLNAFMSAALVLVAASLVIDPDSLSVESRLTVLACFLAPLVFATQIQYLSKPLQKISITRRMAWGTLGHIVVLLPIAALQAPIELLPDSWIGIWAILGIALIAAALPQFLFLIGAPQTAPEITAIVGSAELIVALLTGAVLLGEQLGRLEITAMLLILIALCIRQTGEQN